MRLIATEPQLRSVDGALAAGAVCSAGAAVANHLAGWSCPFYAMTGWWCPFCGGTRTIVALAHGNLGSALQYNGLVVLVLVFAATRLILLIAGRQAVLDRTDWWIKRVNLRVWAIVLLAWTIGRNLLGSVMLDASAVF